MDNKTKLKYTNKKGLIINDTIIKKISGPVSFHLLVPNKKTIEDSKITLPVIILFGDIHYSDLNICSPCDEKNNCYPIWTREFLNILDKDGYTFNIEHAFSKDFAGFNYDSTTTPYERLLSYIHYCIKKDTKKCPTKNIRWNYVNTREVDDNFTYNFESKFQEIFNYFFDMSAIFNKPEIKSQNLDYFFLRFIHFVIYLDDSYIEIIDIILEMLENKNFDAFFNNENNRNTSLIYKQIKKMPINFNLDFWKDKMNKYLQFIYENNNLEKMIDFLRNFKQFKNSDFISRIKLEDNLNKAYVTDDYYSVFDQDKKKYFIVEILNFTTTGIGQFLNKFNSIFLDIYYILRTFKPIDKKTVLSIGFFGYYHNINLIYFLTDILKSYTLTNEIMSGGGERILDVKKIDFNDRKRCLDFSNEQINLDKYFLTSSKSLKSKSSSSKSLKSKSSSSKSLKSKSSSSKSSSKNISVLKSYNMKLSLKRKKKSSKSSSKNISVLKSDNIKLSLKRKRKSSSKSPSKNNTKFSLSKRKF